MKSIDYNSDYKPTWCPGCGNFGIWNGIKSVLAELEIPEHKVCLVYGIGCSGNMNNTIKTYVVHGIHGRAIPVASGIRLVNNSLKVIIVGGDGDGYGIGLGHFIHACRRNFDMTYVVSNNQIYGLTTGQYSPTSAKGHVTKTSLAGAIEEPLNPILQALVSGATFVARGFSGDPVHLNQMIKAGLEHQGFSLIDVFQPCVTFNKINTYEFFRQRVYKLAAAGHQTSSFNDALIRAQEFGEKIPIGIFYEVKKPIYEDAVLATQERSLAEQTPNQGFIDVSKSLDWLQ